MQELSAARNTLELLKRKLFKEKVRLKILQREQNERLIAYKYTVFSHVGKNSFLQRPVFFQFFCVSERHLQQKECFPSA